MKWHDLGQHQYQGYWNALLKSYEMRDTGHTARVVTRTRSGKEWYCVQIYE